MLQQARSLIETGQRQQAAGLLCRLADALREQGDSTGHSAGSLAELAFFFSQIKAFDKAAEWFEKAVRLSPNNPLFLYNLATMRRILGDLPGAELALDQALVLNPADGEAQHLRSSLRTQTREQNHIDQLRLQLDMPGLPPKQRVHLYYALAKELEDLGQYKEAFSALKAGADKRRQHLNYDVRQDLTVMDQLARVFNAAKLQRAGAGCDNAEPIFILGMPRTGSTVVERMLGSHSQVSMAGELNNFAQQMMGQIKRQAQVSNMQQAIEASGELDFASLGQAYIDSTRPDTGQKAHFIDKLPLNFLYVGLIHLALPNARIIEVQRDPMDCCYAVYKHLFTHAYPFSYDLKELGAYYQGYQKLMSHWKESLPGRIHTIRYESLTDSPEPVLRHLLKHCQLEWQEACLSFEKNRAASTTGSAAQIRQSLYTGSVGKWRHYHKELQPLQQALSKPI